MWLSRESLVITAIELVKSDHLIPLQGGGIATAFSAHFPHLVNGKVALIASAGIMEVNFNQQSKV